MRKKRLQKVNKLLAKPYNIRVCRHSGKKYTSTTHFWRRFLGKHAFLLGCGDGE